MYAARLTHGPVALAFTDRHGGVSGAPYDTLNLAWAGGDDPEALAENRRLLAADFAPDDFRLSPSMPRFSEENFAKNVQLADNMIEIAHKYKATPSQIALAWILAESPNCE